MSSNQIYPFSWVYDENGITETMKNLSIPLQYLVAAALEVTDVTIFRPSGFTMGMNNWNIAQMRIFGNIQLLLEKSNLIHTYMNLRQYS